MKCPHCGKELAISKKDSSYAYAILAKKDITSVNNSRRIPIFHQSIFVKNPSAPFARIIGICLRLRTKKMFPRQRTKSFLLS